MRRTAIALAAGFAMFGIGATHAADAAKGEEIYKQVCFACHDAGVAGAPKIGDKAAWEARIAKGEATLDKHAIEGFTGEAGSMPPKGGRTDLSDEAVKDAVAYMIEKSK